MQKFIPLVSGLLLLSGGLAFAADIPVGDSKPNTDAHCMTCHSSRVISGKSGRNVHIDPAVFKATAHADVGCIACHEPVPSRHPGDGLAMPKVDCNKCHEQTSLEYAKGQHAGNASCTDCHDAHAVKAPVATSADQMNARCATCHETPAVMAKHAEWLPQTQLHMNFVPCVACHTASKDYSITLFIGKKSEDYASQAFAPLTHEQFAEHSTRDKPARNLIDQNNDGDVSLDELRYFNRNSQDHGMWLYGVMMPDHVTHSFETPINRADCTFCHATGPDARQTSYVAIPQENSRFARLPVEKGAILDILYGTPDFYMIGATRSPILSILAGLIIMGGAGFPLVHGTFRFLTRRNRQKKEH